MKDRIEITTFEEYLNYLTISKKELVTKMHYKEDGLTDDDSYFILIDLVMEGVKVKFIINEALQKKFLLKITKDSQSFFDKICKVLNK